MTMRKYLVLFAMSLGLAFYVARQENNRPKDSTGRPEGHSPTWYDFVRWPTGTTAWAVVLTLMAIAEQTAQTARAAKATERAVETAEKSLTLQKDTAKTQLRPYIGLKGARLFLHEDGSVEPRVELVNSGQTPAYDLHGGHLARFTTYPPTTPGRPPEDMRVSTGMVAAGGSYYLLGDILSSGKTNPKQVLDALSAPDCVFCLNGYYLYRDIFGDMHKLEFQILVGGPSGNPRVDKDESGQIYAVFSNDSAGNNAD